MYQILVVEDEPTIANALRRFLSDEGYLVEVAFDGETGLDLIQQSDPDLIILDVILPKVNGLDICREIRASNLKEVPILMITALGTSDNVIKGLDAGADDYVTKPFKMREVAARVRALLRRSKNNGTSPGSVLQLGDLQLNKDTRKAVRNGLEITLTATEYRLLECFMNNPRRVLSRMDLLDSVWGVNYRMDTNVVDVYVNFLRKKVDKPFGSRLIHTVVGMGYVLKES
jgi:DNA-binding response OmpR family regulator